MIPCPRTILCNNCEQNNLFGDILNAGDNADDQEDYGFRTSFFKITPTVIYDYTTNKLMNMLLEILRPHINIENNDKQSDERNQVNMNDDMESDEINKIGENREETFDTDIEVLKLLTLGSQRKTILIKNLMK